MNKWSPYPASRPDVGLYGLSDPLLFHTRDATGDWIRHGYFDDETNCFYEDGKKPRRAWRAAVKQFYFYPLPSLTEIEDGSSE